MFYTNGKILIHKSNDVEKLERAELRLLEYLTTEKGIDCDDLIMQTDEEKNFPYYELPEGVSAVDVHNALYPDVTIKAINEDIFLNHEETFITIKYHFTDDEIHKMQHDASAEFINSMKLKIEKSSVQKEYNARIAALEEKIQNLSEKSIRGWETKEQKCKLKYDYVHYKRYYVDVNDESLIYKTEEMQPADFQLRIDHTAKISQQTEPPIDMLEQDLPEAEYEEGQDEEENNFLSDDETEDEDAEADFDKIELDEDGTAK